MDFVLPKFRHRVRARWTECDAQRLVFNATYLNYFEIVQAEYFRALDIPIYDPKTWETFAYVVRKADCEFLQPVFLDEAIDLLMAIRSMGKSSLKVTMAVQKADNSELAFVCDLLLVNFDNDTNASRPVPDWVREKVAAYEEIDG